MGTKPVRKSDVLRLASTGQFSKALLSRWGTHIGFDPIESLRMSRRDERILWSILIAATVLFLVTCTYSALLWVRGPALSDSLYQGALSFMVLATLVVVFSPVFLAAAFKKRASQARAFITFLEQMTSWSGARLEAVVALNDATLQEVAHGILATAAGRIVAHERQHGSTAQSRAHNFQMDPWLDTLVSLRQAFRARFEALSSLGLTKEPDNWAPYFRAAEKMLDAPAST